MVNEAWRPQHLGRPFPFRQRGGRSFEAPNRLVAQPMESNAAAEDLFLPGLLGMEPQDIVARCRELVQDESYVRQHFMYDAERVQRRGFPSAFQFLDVAERAQGGFGISFFEATAYDVGGLARLMGGLLNEETAPAYRKLVEVFRASCLDPRQLFMVQLGHAGWCGTEPVSFRNYLGQGIHQPSEEKLEQILDGIVRSATLAQEVGFDGADIKACHGYFLADWLSYLMKGANTRSEGEVRLQPYLAFMQHVRDAVGDDFLVGARVSFYEGVPNGWGVKYDPSVPADLPLDHTTLEKYGSVEIDLRAPLYYAAIMREHLDFFNSSLGTPVGSPTLVRPTRRRNPAGLILHIHITKRVQETVGKDFAVIGSGYTSGGVHAPILADYVVGAGHAQFAGFGRATLADRHFARKVLQGDLDSITFCDLDDSICSHLLAAQKTAVGCYRNQVIDLVRTK